MQLGREPRGLEDRLHAVEGNQLPYEDGVEGLVGAPARMKQVLLGADQADLDAGARNLPHLGQEVGVRLGVGNDEVRLAERAPVHGREHPGRE